MTDEFRQKAIDYHKFPRPGKLAIEATTPLATQTDLALAYSPGVAYACEEIEKDPLTASDYTARSNLVGVVSNGTAVLGLGAIGALAGKPVMEGKAVLFKKFANIDVFDIEINENDPMKLAETIERLEPTFGGINLEDIKAPDCFIVEEYLKERMSIPVFHDDQHGTAIVVAAAMTSALDIVGKPLDQVKLVASGAGAASLACLNLLVSMGMPRENIIISDSSGVVYKGRSEKMDSYKERYAADTPHRSLAEAIVGADVFLGLSGANVLKPEMVKAMADNPVIFALANPNPEISPPEARKVRDDLIIATGRSDYPNQVNNVLCFPFLFRGALDVGATEINEAMKIASVHAISRLAKAGTSDIVSSAYVGETLRYGPEYLIPKPFDPRLIVEISSAVAQAAMDSGVATRPIADMQEYRQSLSSYVYQSGMVMKPIFDMARGSQCRVVFAEGENLRVLQAADNLVHDKIAFPVLLGQPDVIKSQIETYGLELTEGQDYEIYSVDEDRFTQCYFELMQRKGVSEQEARCMVRSDTTLQAALIVKLGDADSMICGSIGRFHNHLEQVLNVAGQSEQDNHLATLNVHILRSGMLFIGDTQVKVDPSAEDIAQLAVNGAKEVARFGVEPRVALVSHSNFGNRDSASSKKMRHALELIREMAPDLNVDGEMQADAALSTVKRNERMPGSTLTGEANLLIMPNLDAGNITSNSLKTLGSGVTIGPLLMGCNLSANIATSSITVRGLVNLTTVTVVQHLNKA
jgi:malate dehydrogenase (oxaloacetate-decarboxylating)(NADP+)